MSKSYRNESTTHEQRRIERRHSAKLNTLSRRVARNNAKSQQILFAVFAK